MSASSPGFRYLPTFSPSSNGDDMSYPSFLDQPPRFSSTSPTPSTSSYSFSSAQPSPQPPPPAQPLPTQAPPSNASFHSLAMSVPSSHSMRPSAAFPPSSAHSQQPQHLPPSHQQPQHHHAHQQHPQQRQPSQLSASASLPQPLSSSSSSASHLSGSVPLPHRPAKDEPLLEIGDSSYALLASLARKRERDHLDRSRLDRLDRTLQLPLPPHHFHPEDLSEAYVEGPYHPDRFSHFPSAPPGYENMGPFPSSVSSESSGSSTSSPMPRFMLPSSAREPSPVVYRKSSCLLCHRAKTSCDGRRPCDRCIRLDRQDQCVERTKGSSKRKPVVVGKKRKTGEDGGEDDSKEDEHEKGDGDDEEALSPLPQPAPSTTTAAASPSGASSTSSSASSASSPPALPSSSSASGAILTESGENNLISVSERELSSLMLRILQSEQVAIRSLLRTASQRKMIPDMAFQALISYLANALHPDDYSAFMIWIDSEGSEADSLDRLQIRLPDGKRMPRVLFTFRKSSLVALPDSEIAVNTAQILVWRVKPGVQAGAAIDKPAQPPLDGVKVKKEREDGGQPPRSASSPATTSTTSSSSPPSTLLSPTRIAMTDGDELDPLSPSSDYSMHAPPPHPTSATSPFVPAPVPGATFGSLSEVDLVIQVNREFERLFGYSQREMKDLVMREQAKGLYRLYTPESLLTVGRWLTEAVIGIRTEFRAIVNVVNKGKGITPVVFNARFILDAAGFFSSVCYSYCVLPPTPGAVE